MTWTFTRSQVGWQFAPAGGGQPLPPIDSLPIEDYVSRLLSDQRYPLDLTLSHFFQGVETAPGVITDAVTGATMTASLGATIGLAPRTALDIRSKLSAGIIDIPSMAARVDASDPDVMDIGTKSALIIWCFRAADPSPSGTRFLINKRADAGDVEGWEVGVNVDGKLDARTKPGAGALVPTTLAQNTTGEQAPGVWIHCAMLVDRNAGLLQVATNRETGPTVPLSGDLGTITPFSIGRGRAAGFAKTAQILYVGAFFGEQVENLFNLTPGPGVIERTLRDSVCMPLHADVSSALGTGPIPIE